MHDLSKKVSDKVEVLCQQGCRQVNQFITDAKNGKKIASLSALNHNEIEQVINELDQIMSVYASENDNNNKSIK